jgi:hypothetical protein
MLLTPQIIQFLYAHPGIETLCWPTISPVHIPGDCLPSLKHLSAPDTSFLVHFLGGKKSASLHLESLSDVALTAELLPYMEALDPWTLHRLHIKTLDSYETLRTLASKFSALKEISLPRQGAWKENARFTTRISRAIFRPWFRDLQLLPLADLLAIFPYLCVIQGVRCPAGLNVDWAMNDPRALNALTLVKLSYPQLQRVNRWKLLH